MSTHYDGFCTDCGSWTAVHDGRCGCGSGRVALPPAGFSIVHKDEMHAPSVERCIDQELFRRLDFGSENKGAALEADECRSIANALRELMKEVGR